MPSPVNTPPRVFKSAVGGFYYGILVFIAVVTITSFKPAFEQTPGLALLPALVFTLVVGWGLPLWMLFTTDYTVTDDELKIRCGPFRYTITRSDITGIKPSRNPVSSPALSLDRLQVSYGRNKTIHVSPKDRAGFYRALGFMPHPQ